MDFKDDHLILMSQWGLAIIILTETLHPVSVLSYFLWICFPQVPKGWDKLSVSLISVETGKTISKSGKASVRNGHCKWTETWSHSMWITPDDISNKQEQFPLKFIVTMVRHVPIFLSVDVIASISF